MVSSSSPFSSSSQSPRDSFSQDAEAINPGWVYVGMDHPSHAPAQEPIAEAASGVSLAAPGISLATLLRNRDWLKRLALPLLGVMLLISTLFTPSAAEAAGQTRTLRPRETLVEIAHEWKTTPETLRFLNKMGTADLAWGGQKFVLPKEKGLIVYTVQEGDSQQSVAAANGMSLAEFMEINKLSPSSVLMPGSQVLVRSDKGLWASKEIKVYTVAEEDTIESIAAIFETQASVIRTINGIANGRTPEVGTQLLIPTRDIVERLGNTARDANGYLQIAIEDFPTLTEKWVDIDLSHQRMTAYEGTKPVYTAYISSGKARTPTVTGVFRIWAKISSQTMSGGSVATGDYYNLPGVQWVSYFYKDYALHGAYWHNRFGTPTSHGCVNLTNRDAEWLYNWMTPDNPGRGWYTTDKSDQMGTLVVVHR